MIKKNMMIISLIFILMISSVSALKLDNFGNRCDVYNIVYGSGEVFQECRTAFDDFYGTCNYVDAQTGVIYGSSEIHMYLHQDAIASCIKTNDPYKPFIDTPKVDEFPFFKITAIENKQDFKISEIGKADFQIGIKNTGVGGKKKVEVGIAKCSTIESWSSSVFSAIGIKTSNCNQYEKNVETYEVSLNQNEETTIEFSVEVPDVDATDGWSFFSKDYDKSYCVFVQTYNECYKLTGADGKSDSAYKQVWIDDFTPGKAEETCSDGIENQDETDTDCGGICSNEGNPCNNGYRCENDEDCKLSQVCSINGRCNNEYIPTDLPECADKTGLEYTKCYLGTFNLKNLYSVAVVVLLIILGYFVFKKIKRKWL